jgi:hypothetical protein
MGIQKLDTQLLTLPHSKRNKKKELNTIINIALNNGYRKEDILHIHNKLKYQQDNLGNNIEKTTKMGDIHLHRKLHT